jgi:hypothetical protein
VKPKQTPKTLHYSRALLIIGETVFGFLETVVIPCFCQTEALASQQVLGPEDENFAGQLVLTGCDLKTNSVPLLSVRLRDNLLDPLKLRDIRLD